MQPHQQRVVEERSQLNERVEKLDTFLAKGQPSFIDDAEWGRLTEQFEVMTRYLNILDARISNF